MQKQTLLTNKNKIMQKTQNADVQRVINLVDLYRTKVGEESEIAKEAKANCEYWEEINISMMQEEGITIGGFVYGNGPHTEAWIKHLMVNEQLLGHFYAEVSGEKAQQDVLNQLLADNYDRNIFSEEEETFLRLHFKDLVNYIIQSPCNESLRWVCRHDSKDVFTIPSEVLELIDSRVEIASGSKVYYPNTAFAQLANLYDDSTFYVDSANSAWTRVAIYANSVDTREITDNTISQSYDAIVSYLPNVSDCGKIIQQICEAYNNLSYGGKLVLLCPSELLAEDTNSSLRRMLVDDHSIKEIIQLPRVMSTNASSDTYCLLIAEKGSADHSATLIDAQTASAKSDTKHYMLSFDLAKFNAIIANDGKDPNTGLRKVVKVPTVNLSQRLLVPKVYTIEKPSEAESPVPLSSLCTLNSVLVQDVKFDLPEETPWIVMNDLNPLFTGNINMSDIRKADCPNNPPFVEDSKDSTFDKNRKFNDSVFGQMNTEKRHYIMEYRQCNFLDGNTDAVLYGYSEKYGGQVAIVRAMGKPYAVSKGILVFCPKSGFDANSLAALLRLPYVYRQLELYRNYGIGYYLDDVLVSKEKRVICDESLRMTREEFVTKELEDKVRTMKTEYVNEVRMRKHDMGQKVFDLINTEDLMRYYVENHETECDLWSQLEEQLDHFRSTINDLSEMLDHLSQEERFGSPDLIDLDEYLKKLQHSNNISGFALSYQLDRDIVIDYLTTIKGNRRMPDVEIHPVVLMAKNDIQRVVGNILSNAQKHGFVDVSRHDYKVEIRLTINTEKEMYQIDFCNNGQPFPKGIDKIRYGIKGEKAGPKAGTGLGGSVVKSIVEHYKGDYDILMKGEWTIVRVYLPITI